MVLYCVHVLFCSIFNPDKYQWVSIRFCVEKIASICLITHSADTATLALIWSRLTVHLTDESQIFSLPLALFCFSPTPDGNIWFFSCSSLSRVLLGAGQVVYSGFLELQLQTRLMGGKTEQV